VRDNLARQTHTSSAAKPKAKAKRKSGDPTTAYAHDIVSGRIVAGELVIATCKRHLRDIADGGSRGLVWNPAKAQHAIDFFPAMLTVTAGTHEGRPFKLLPWHVFVVGNLFGWQKKSGRLRYRRAWLETGKGQAKSPLMAAVGLYLMGFYGVPRSEIYAIGQDRNVANVLFRDAVAMCRARIPGGEGETLESIGEVVTRGTLDNTHKIEHEKTGSKFQAIANGEAISGPRPTAVLADEIHEFRSDAPLETWNRAIAKMPGDAMMVLGTNTPASTQIVGTNYSEFFQKVSKGEVDDDEAFAYIARVDKADRETVFDNEDCWVKALPALDITFPRENTRGEVNTARTLTSTAMSVKRLYFGIPTGVVDFWISEDAWVQVQGSVDPDEMAGNPCWLSLDLSQKNDLTALTAVWRDSSGHFHAFTWYWTTRHKMEDRAKADNAPYPRWVREGFLYAVPGAIIDKAFVAEKVAELVAKHDVQMLVFDPAGIGDFISACGEVGLDVWQWVGPEAEAGQGLMIVSHAQGTRVKFEGKQLCMPRSVERLEDLILEGGITVSASPVTYSCAANAALISDAQKNRAFDKKRSRGRIDGLVTLTMAAGAATTQLIEGQERQYQMLIL
jgi:phage terminase large subunit-like protein